jgi:ERF superfamily
MKTSEQIDKVLPALANVKQNLQAVIKGTKNPFYKSSYADLNTHLEAVEPLLEQNGLLLFQPVVDNTTNNVVTSRIYHVQSGQYVESSMKLVGETDMQKAGSGVTYARRYTLSSLLSMTAEDDDGNHASNKIDKKSQASVQSKPTASVQAAQAEVTAQATKTSRPSFRDRLNKPKTEVTETVSSGDDL